MLPDKKILNGKKNYKNSYKIVPNNSTDQTLNIWKWWVSNGNRTRYLLGRRRVLYTKGYWNGRI